jgi:hypothetical protein
LEIYPEASPSQAINGIQQVNMGKSPRKPTMKGWRMCNTHKRGQKGWRMPSPLDDQSLEHTTNTFETYLLINGGRNRATSKERENSNRATSKERENSKRTTSRAVIN